MEQQMLKDKVAIITGASYGMGRTMAELFADEGAAVVITARHAQQLNEVVDGIRAKGGKAVGVVADVCSTEDTKKVFETALREFGDVDILINNAGIGEQKMIDETDDDWMMYVMNTNSHRPNISSVISGYKQPSKSAQNIEITGFIEKSKPPEIIFLYTLLPLTA